MSKRGEFLLDSPYLKAKYDKLTNQHVHTEELMDRWQKENEAMAKKKEKGVKHGKAKGVKGKHGGRKKGTRSRVKQDQSHHARTESSASEASGGDGDEYGAGGATDATGGLHPGEEEEMK